MAIKKTKEITYEDLLRKVQSFLADKYGSLTHFVESEDYRKVCGFLDTPQTKRKVLTYLSVPKNEQLKKVKSLPVLKTIAEKLMKREVSSTVVVEKRTTIMVDVDF